MGSSPRNGRRNGGVPQWPAGSLLGRLSEPVRAAMLDLGTRATYPPRQPLLRLGTPDQHAFLLLDGCVKVTGNDGGREPLLAVRVRGDLVGEMATLSGTVRSATVSSCTVITARRIAGTMLRTFLATHPEAALAVAGMLSERLRWANERRIDFAVADAATRVSRVLVALAEAYGRDTAAGRDLGVSLTQEEIASLAGTRLPTAEKALRALAKAGVVQLGYRSIVVTDMAGLRASADP